MVYVCTEAETELAEQFGPLAIAQITRPRFPKEALAEVGNRIEDDNTAVMASVYGGGELAQVYGSTDVTVSNGTIGVAGFGGVEYGNVYGGGKGSIDVVDAGLVKTDTKVTVSGTSPMIWHNVYGGGAFGSVGTFDYDNYNVITGHTANTGTAAVYITGGTIGSNGQENGMIFGSSRGDVGAPNSIHDHLAWVYDTKVIIHPAHDVR